MCFGSVKAPKIVYQGPSAEEIQFQRQQLETYSQQSAAQQEQMTKQLQQQIEQANRDAETQRQQLEREQAQAAADMAAQQQGAYAATATQTDPVDAQVTETVKPKKKPGSSLQIGQGSVATAAGTGLNIGV